MKLPCFTLPPTQHYSLCRNLLPLLKRALRFSVWGFSVIAVFRFWLFFRSGFQFLRWITGFFYFGVCISLRVFVFLAVGFRFAEEMPAIFSDIISYSVFLEWYCSFEDFRRWVASNVRTDKLVQFLGLNLVQMVEKFRIGILNLGINRLY